MTYQLQDVINWFLSKEAMTPKKLQKILYYAYSWHLTFENDDPDNLERRLFDERFEAWVHGPVIPSVYEDYKHKGYNEIEQYRGKVAKFDADTKDTLEQVWITYGKYNGNQLESISHQESPWKNARKGYQALDRCNEEISDEDIFECYVARLEA